jgi:hypothetical protein
VSKNDSVTKARCASSEKNGHCAPATTRTVTSAAIDRLRAPDGAGNVALAQRTPFEAAETPAKIRALAAHHRRHGIAALHGQIRPTPGAPAAEFENAAGAQSHRTIHRHLAIADARRQVGAANCNHGGLVERERRSHQRDLQRRFVFGIADEQIGEPVRPLVHHAVDDDAETLIAIAPEVLQRRQRPRLGDANHRCLARAASYASRLIGTNRTSSPAASRQGGSSFGANSRTGVRPITFQPPGVSSA